MAALARAYACGPVDSRESISGGRVHRVPPEAGAPLTALYSYCRNCSYGQNLPVCLEASRLTSSLRYELTHARSPNVCRQHPEHRRSREPAACVLGGTAAYRRGLSVRRHHASRASTWAPIRTTSRLYGGWTRSAASRHIALPRKVRAAVVRAWACGRSCSSARVESQRARADSPSSARCRCASPPQSPACSVPPRRSRR